MAGARSSDELMGMPVTGRPRLITFVMEYKRDSEPDVVMTAAEPAESDTDVLITDATGVVRQVICSPQKHRSTGNVTEPPNVSEGPFSQVLDPTQHTVAAAGNDVADSDTDSDSDNDFVYTPHSDDSGEDSEVVELRRHARKFKKKMRDSKSWIGSDATGCALSPRSRLSDSAGGRTPSPSFRSRIRRGLVVLYPRQRHLPTSGGNYTTAGPQSSTSLRLELF
ncbi:hypothetical protein ZWY2020_014477 [Hordeum vulgare]|nr:hypothetical protein ZWY2020_014477 [Hordeum vulgare]